MSCYTPEYLFCKKPDFIFCLISGKCEADGYYKIDKEENKESKEDFEGDKDEERLRRFNSSVDARKKFKENIIALDEKRKLKSRKVKNNDAEIKNKLLVKNKLTNLFNHANNRARLESDSKISSTDLQHPKTNFQVYLTTQEYVRPNIQTCHSKCFLSQNEVGHFINWCFTHGGWKYCSLTGA